MQVAIKKRLAYFMLFFLQKDFVNMQKGCTFAAAFEVEVPIYESEMVH